MSLLVNLSKEGRGKTEIILFLEMKNNYMEYVLKSPF